MKNEELKSRIRQKVSLAVIAIDDFTGKIITGSGVYVYIEGEKKPVKKDEGYYIFLNLKKTKYILKIGGTFYNEQKVEIDLDNQEIPMKIRLFPNRQYPIPNNTVCIEGKAEPNSQIRIICEKSDNTYKLLNDYQQNDEENNQKICIYHLNLTDLEGKIFYIESKDNGYKEEFIIKKILDKESKTYLLTQKLKNSYKKAGTVLHILYTAPTDSGGNFFLPISDIQGTRIICEIPGNKNITKEYHISSKYNYLDLSGEG